MTGAPTPSTKSCCASQDRLPTSVHRSTNTADSLVTDGNYQMLGPEAFHRRSLQPERPAENLEQRRSVLYDKIVDPLRQLVEGTGLHTEIDRFELTALVSRDKPRTAFPHSEKQQTRLTVAEVSIDEIHTVVSESDSDSWLEEITQLNKMLKKETRKSGTKRKPVRIAILDTVYDENAPSLDIRGRSMRIKEWRDFVSNSPGPINTQIECPTDKNKIAQAIRTAATD